MLKLILLACSAVLAATVVSAAPSTFSSYVTYDGTNFKIVPDEPNSGSYCMISGNYAVNQTGWNEITLTGSKTALADADSKAALETYRACGYAEGYFYAEQAYNALYNAGMSKYMEMEPRPVDKEGDKREAGKNATHNFVLQMWNNLCKEDQPKDITGQSTKRFVNLIKGFTAGINAKTPNTPAQFTELNLFFFSNQAASGDFYTAATIQQGLAQAKKKPEPIPRPNGTTLPPRMQQLDDVSTFKTVAETANTAGEFNSAPDWLDIAEKMKAGTHCSALVRLAKDDLFFSHVTWSGFSSMSDRVVRTWNFENSVMFSSYIVSLSSIDDWYVSPHLAVLETTLVQENNEITAKYLTPERTPASFRIMAALLWATSPKMSNDIIIHNSGGDYANSWMSLSRDISIDQIKSKKLPAGSIWMTEDLPGEPVTGDITSDLVKNGYIEGDNIAYFAKTYQVTLEALQCSQGSIFCQTNYSRAEIFKRNATSIETIAHLQKMMRYNDWQNDPLSTIPNCPGCNPANNAQLTISNRADLVPLEANFAELYDNKYGINNPAFLSAGNFGGIDAKMIAFSENTDANKVVAHVQSGPTHDQQPVFSWSTTKVAGARPRGAKDTFDFGWVTPGATKDGVALSRSTKAPWPVSTESSKSPGLSGGAIAGIAIGCVVAVFCLVFAVKSWKQKRGGTEISDEEQQTDDNPGVRYDTLNE